MGKNSRKNKARMPHANSRDEVIQRAKEQAAANKLPLTEEEILTLDEAREILAKKEEILTEAEQEKERILLEINTKKAELQELDKAYEATLNKVSPHQIVDGTIISIDKDEVVVNIDIRLMAL